MSERFDVVIVGGGSAGCAMAHRVSADGNLTVALIEAGPDTPPNHRDEVLWQSYPIIAYFDPRHHWTDLRVRYGPRPEGEDTRPLSRYEQAKVMGGGSSINGQMANRGQPADYDEWAALGATGWDWAGVLPYFKRMERDLDLLGDDHGTDGPIPIRRVPHGGWPGFSRAAADALAARGLPLLADQNATDFPPGYFPITINNEGNRRASTATGYLDAETRARPNLTILADTRVRRVTIENKAVTGVEVVDKAGTVRQVAAAEVVLSSGAIHTPALLLKSGIGPGEQLRANGVEVVADRGGVGGNLHEHPQVAVTSYLRPEMRVTDQKGRHIFVGFRYSSRVGGTSPVDMYGVVVNKGGWHPLGRRMGGFLLWVNKAYSKGEVTLTSGDLDAAPAVDLNLLSDPRDAQRLAEGVKFIAGLYRHPSMERAAEFPFVTNYNETARDLAVVTRGNWLKTIRNGLAVDASAALREKTLRERVSGGNDLTAMAADDDRLQAFLRERVVGTWHCCGTCRMGHADDPLAVTDPAGRVIGVGGLRVADASVMPNVPCGNTNLSAIMVGEKMADLLLADR